MDGFIDYQAKIDNFKLLTDTQSDDLAFSHLEASNWDENVA